MAPRRPASPGPARRGSTLAEDVRRLAARAEPAMGLLAIAAVGGWNALQDRGATVIGIPMVGGWLSLLAAFLAGVGAVGVVPALSRSADRRRAPVALAGAIAVGVVAVVLLVRDARPSRLLVEAGFAAWIVTMVAAGSVAGRRWPSLATDRLALVALVIAIWAMHDAAIWGHSSHFYDFRVYMAAGVHERLGQPVYLPGPLTVLPSGAANDYFLYPPPLIPLLVVLSHVSISITGPLFAISMVGCAVAGFRLLGLSWAWSILLVAFPPLSKGIESGNVANLTFLLYVAAIRYGPGVIAGVLFKVQNAIPALWLLRERRWRAAAMGIGILVAAAVVTLPFVGLTAWRDWIAGLGYRQQSQVNLPILYGESLALVVPTFVFVALSGIAVLAALAFRGRRGLAALGLASIVASPSLWPHGFIMAIPALLALPMSPLVWLGFGVGAGGTIGNWLMVIVSAGAVLFARWNASISPDPLHPVGGTFGPWAEAVRTGATEPTTACDAAARPTFG